MLKDADGGLTIHIQNESRGKVKELADCPRRREGREEVRTSDLTVEVLGNLKEDVLYVFLK